MPQSQPDQRKHLNPVDLTPIQIARELSRHIIGQDAAVERMSLSVRQHALNVGIQKLGGVVPPDPATRTPATLLVGPSGSGKTLLAKASASLLDVPYYGDDCTSLSETGYVGKDLGACLAQLLLSCNGIVQKAESGTIVFLDEADKTRRHSTISGPDVSGEGVQRQLLSILEGSVLQVQVPEGRRGRIVTMRTSGMWVILAGSFAAGLSRIVHERLGARGRRIGFGAGESVRERRLREGELLLQAIEEDYIRFGMLPELISRVIPITLRDLDVDDLRRILTSCEDGPLQKAEILAAREGIELRFTPRCLDRIAAEAYASGLGARSLSPAISRATRRIMYELPDVVRRRSGSGMLLVELDEGALQDEGAYRVVRRRKEV